MNTTAAAQDALVPETPKPLRHPHAMPKLYALICDGACVEPVYKDGQALLFSSVEPWRAGDFVAIYLKPGVLRPGENPVILKQMVSAPPPSHFRPATKKSQPERTLVSRVIVRMLNPQRSLILNAGDVLAIHKCLGPLQ